MGHPESGVSEEKPMATKAKGGALPADAKRLLRSVSEDLKALDRMNLKELQAKFLLLYGVETHSKNPTFLRKKLAWKIQELREGGLSEDAKARLEALMPKGPLRKQANGRLGTAPPVSVEPPPVVETAIQMALQPAARAVPRDPRLPEVGSTIRRVVSGEAHEVKVLEQGFTYRGETFRSLSAIAKAITGTAWNGYLFFGLKGRS